MIWMCFGVAFYSFMISNLQSIAFDEAMSKDTLKAKINTVNEFQRDTNIDDNLVNCLKIFLEFKQKVF